MDIPQNILDTVFCRMDAMRQGYGWQEEVWSYVMMQKDYQYRILICDRDDFAVLEMLEGRMIFPDVQSLEQFQQAQKDGGMEMI